jgi:hypothetical protein
MIMMSKQIDNSSSKIQALYSKLYIGSALSISVTNAKNYYNVDPFVIWTSN